MSEPILVNSLAIITAQNPFGAKLSHNTNYDLNRKLRLELQDHNHPAMQMEGTYAGNQEHSFLVVNIPRARLVELAQRYKQRAVIWAFVREQWVPEPYMHFQYLEDGKVIGNKVVWVPKSLLESPDELFHAVRTGSFKLPVLEREAKPEVEPTTEFTFD